MRTKLTFTATLVLLASCSTLKQWWEGPPVQDTFRIGPDGTATTEPPTMPRLRAGQEVDLFITGAEIQVSTEVVDRFFEGNAEAANAYFAGLEKTAFESAEAVFASMRGVAIVAKEEDADYLVDIKVDIPGLNTVGSQGSSTGGTKRQQLNNSSTMSELEVEVDVNLLCRTPDKKVGSGICKVTRTVRLSREESVVGSGREGGGETKDNEAQSLSQRHVKGALDASLLGAASDLAGSWVESDTGSQR